MRHVLSWAMLSLLLIGCDAQHATSSRPEAELVLFSAPWCEPCKRQIPAAVRAADGKASVTTVYVETGTSPSQPPTEASAAQYKEMLGIAVPVIPDVWHWKKFKQWVGKDLRVPAGVALSKDGKVLQKFNGGHLAEEVGYFFSVPAKPIERDRNVEERNEAGTGHQ